MAHTPTYTNSAQQIQTPDISRPLSNSVVASTAPPAIPNISGLFEALVKAGVVSATSTPTGAGATIHAQSDSKPQFHDTQSPRESNVEDSRVYRTAILAEDVKFSSAEISR
jgi:pre-mRNA cleavage complex 2 protein Pcf11